MTKRRRNALIAVVCAQLAVPLGMAGLAEADLAFGREVRLRAQPVDPLDVFRGNFVVLTYGISNLPVTVPVTRGQRVCVRLTERGEEWTGSFADTSEPEGTSICGRARSDADPGESVGIEYGIENYFASAERAQELEEEIAGGDLYVVVDLDDDGSAKIERVEVDGS